jgi:GT2 family glycosyltransferase
MRNRTNTPDISVIIPVYNGESTLSTCLDAVFRSVDIDMEVIVVDDGSTDRSRDIAAEYPVELISLPESVGGGPARNPGAAVARAPILLHTDADVELLPNTLRQILDAFSGNPCFDALFGSYTMQCPLDNFFSRYKNLHHHFIHQISQRKAETFWSGCGAIRKIAFEAVGGYGSMEFLYDIDLGYRLNRTGYRIELIPNIQVKHHKYYSFYGLIKSDLLGRAVPWTQIMWRHGIFRNDMNTRKTDTASVGMLFLGILMLLLPVPVLTKCICFLGVLGIISLLNLDWWRICLRYGGKQFATKAMAMEWLYFLICGVGAIWGTIKHVIGKWKGSSS